MKTRISMLLIALLSVFALAGCKAGQEGVIIHIKSSPETSEGKHRIVMGLTLASKAIDSGKKALVFFDVKGVTVPLKDSPDITHESHPGSFQSSKATIADILKKGGRIMVCQPCLKVAGHSKEDMMEGIEEGKVSTFFDFTDGRIVTLDW